VSTGVVSFFSSAIRESARGTRTDPGPLVHWPPMGTSGHRTPARQDADGQGRERLLAAASELIFDQFDNGMPIGVVFAHLTPVAIAERAGVSRGLIYHHWPGDPSEGIASMDLLITEVLEAAFARAEDVEELTEAAHSLPDDVGWVMRAFTDDALRKMTGVGSGNAWRVRTILNLCGAPVSSDVPTAVSDDDDGDRVAAEGAQRCAPDDEDSTAVLERLRERWISEERETVFYTGLDIVHLALLERLGLRMRPPLAIRDLTVALVAYTDGIGLGVSNAGARVTREHRWSPISAGCPEGDGWTLYAIGVDALIAGLTDPIET
jgi:AcrR family transcriptional regulator